MKNILSYLDIYWNESSCDLLVLAYYHWHEFLLYYLLWNWFWFLVTFTFPCEYLSLPGLISRLLFPNLLFTKIFIFTLSAFFILFFLWSILCCLLFFQIILFYFRNSNAITIYFWVTKIISKQNWLVKVSISDCW